MNPMENTREAAEAAFQEQEAPTLSIPTLEEMVAAVSLRDRLAGLAEIAQAQEAAGWKAIEANLYSEGGQFAGDMFAEAEVTPGSGEMMMYNVALDEDRKRWYHGVMMANGGALYMTVVPAGTVISPDFARKWIAIRDHKLHETGKRIEENARKALQRELLRKATNS